LTRAAYVVGVGETLHAPCRDDVNTTELAWEAVHAALEDAGIGLADVRGAVTASQDFWEGRTISSISVNEVAGGTLRPESKVAGDGILALLYAAARVAGSVGDSPKLVLAHCKESQADPRAVELASFDPIVQRPLGPDETVIAGLQATLCGFDASERAVVVEAARARSPWLDPITAADVEASAPTADPLRLLERAPRMDGACALVVCDEATARALGRPAVRIAAAATATDAYWSDRDLRRAPALRRAAADALAEAHWEALPEHFELTATFAHQAIAWAQELEVAGGADAFSSGRLSPDGGCLAGRPGIVAGLSAAAACTRRLRESGGRAVAHGTTGLLGQSHHIVCLEAT
jgi:acetyl-CoA C-acetyltransferase